MSRRSAQVVTTPRQDRESLSIPSTADLVMRDLEQEIATNYHQPISILSQSVVERLLSLMSAHGVVVAVGDCQGVVCVASAGNAPELGSHMPPDSGLTRECLETGRAVICLDSEIDSRVRSATATGLGLRSAVVVPLQTNGSVLGVIEVLSSRPFAFNQTHVTSLQHVAELLALALVSPPVPSGKNAAKRFDPRIHRHWSKVLPFFIIGTALSLLLFRHWLVRKPSLTLVVPSAVGPEKPGQQSSLRTHIETGESQSPRNPSPLLSLSTPTLGSKGSTERAPERTTSTASRSIEVLRPVASELVVEGAPPGAQVFVDDELVASIDSAGRAGISTISRGRHRLSLRLNGRHDYDQDVEVTAGETTTVTAELEPFEPPILSASPVVPLLAIVPVSPTLITPTQATSPNFELDRTLKGHLGWVTTVAFSPDGSRLASGSWDRTVKFWIVATGEQVNLVSSKMKEIQALALSKDGRWLATENSSNTVSVRDAITGREIRTLPNDKPLGALGSSWVYSIAFSPDGQWLASGVGDKTVRLWDFKAGQKVRDLTGLHRAITYIAFSPDGRLLASGDDDTSIGIWNTSSGKEMLKLTGHKKPICAVVFSPNGRLLASASADKTVKLWDVPTGREIRTMSGHQKAVTTLAFSPDGRWLVSGSWDKTIKIWDVETGREVQTLTGHDHPVYSVAFDSRGGWLASGSEDGAIKLWRSDTAAGQVRSRR
jgi:WD40 repeat protein